LHFDSCPIWVLLFPRSYMFSVPGPPRHPSGFGEAHVVVVVVV
jgi:hypothetical protein